MKEFVTIPVLHRAVAVLEAIGRSRTGLSVKKLSLSLRIPSSTCYRIVRTLVEHNWVRENEHGEFQLAFGLALLARSYNEIEHWLQLLEPSLRELAESVGLSSEITICEGPFALTVLRAEPTRANAVTSSVGARFHLAIGAAGAVLLSQLDPDEATRIVQTAPPEAWKRQSPDDTRRRVGEVVKAGITREHGQNHPLIFSASVPLRLSAQIPGALSVVGWPEDFADARHAEIERKLQEKAVLFRQALSALREGVSPAKARRSAKSGKKASSAS